MEDKIKVKYDGRYLQAYMPNGDVIPQQTEIKIENNVGEKDFAYATIQVVADISDLKEMGRPDINWKKTTQVLKAENTELKQELEKEKSNNQVVYKSAVFWEREYNREKSKPWYQKLFGL